MQQEDVDRVQEFRKCIECFLCQDVCHVLRDHHKHEEFIGPRFLVYTAALEMHPLDTEDRVSELKQSQGIGFCNITKCFALMFVPSISPSLTMPSYLSKNAWWMTSTIRLAGLEKTAPEVAANRIVEVIHHAFFERYDGIVSDGDMLGTNISATLGDVTKTDTLRLLQFGHTILGVKRVHLQRGSVNEEARADEFLVLVMVTQNVADVLAEKTFDALAEFLHADSTSSCCILQVPSSASGARGFEFLYFFLNTVIPFEYVRRQIADSRKGPHRLDGDGLFYIERCPCASYT